MSPIGREPRAGRTGRAGIAERVVLLFLVLAAGVLGYIRLYVVGAGGIPPAREFDLVNPLLDARPGECVAVETTARPGEVMCMEVIEPGVVLRPTRQGGEGAFGEDLRRVRPYVLCRLHYPAPGRGCGEDPGAPTEDERFGLDGFGLPTSTPALVQTIRPLWVQRAGRYHFVYEITLLVYGGAGGTLATYLDPDTPVTGTLYRTYARERSLNRITFRAEQGCGSGGGDEAAGDEAAGGGGGGEGDG